MQNSKATDLCWAWTKGIRFWWGATADDALVDANSPLPREARDYFYLAILSSALRAA